MLLKTDSIDFTKFFLSLGIVLGVFVVFSYIPVSLLLAENLNKGIEIHEVNELSKAIGLNNFFIILLLPFVAAFISLLICYRFIHEKNILQLFTIRETFDWKRFFYSFTLWGSILLIFLLISFYTNNFIFWNYNPSTFLGLVMISLFILPIQTTFEEILFRGYIFQLIGGAFRRGWLCVLISGVLFGLMHGTNPEVDKIGNILLVFYIVTGLFLGLVVLMDEGLELTMGYHAVNNIFAAIVITNDWQAFHTDALFIDKTSPEFGIENIITLIFIQPLLLFVFSRKYKWEGWKERLLK